MIQPEIDQAAVRGDACVSSGNAAADGLDGRMLLSFVVPCYHSQETLPKIVDEIFDVVKADGRYDCEVVLVNDNPPDATWHVIEDLCAKDDRVKGACMVHNFGQHNALMAGFSLVSGDVVVCLDDDGQTPPSEAFKLIDALDDEVDAAYADYPRNKHASVLRKLGSNVNDWMARWLLKKPKGLYLSSYIAAKRRVIQEVLQYNGPFAYVDGLMLRSAGKIVNIPVEHRDREVGESGYSMKKLLGLWVNGFTTFSVKPLRISAAAGGIFAFAGFVFALVVFIRKIIFGAQIEAGWTSIVFLLLVIGGILMVMVGLVGEYVGRIFVTMNSAPQFVLRETRNLATDCSVRCGHPGGCVLSTCGSGKPRFRCGQEPSCKGCAACPCMAREDGRDDD